MVTRSQGTAHLQNTPGLIPGQTLQRQAWVLASAGCPREAPRPPHSAMSDYENEDECWSALEGFRVKLTSVLDPARITPYLRQCKVLGPDDEEQVLSDPTLVTRRRKAGQCPLAPAPARRGVPSRAGASTPALECTGPSTPSRHPVCLGGGTSTYSWGPGGAR